MGLLDDVAGAAAGALGIGGAGESWATRLGPAAYTSPSGRRVDFQWRRVERSQTARAQVHEFAGGDGAFVQPLGRGPRSMPVRALLQGPNCDLAAAALEEVLGESGTGKLEHPVYGGPFDVVVVGDIKRRDDPASNGGEVVIDFECVRTLLGAYPATGSTDADDLMGAFDAFQEASAEKFGGVIGGLKKAAGFAKKAVGAYRKTVASTKRALAGVADRQASVRAGMDSVYRDVTNGIDTFAVQPLLLAQSAQRLAQYPATLLGRVGARLSDVAALTAAVVDGYIDMLGGVRSANRQPSAAGARGPSEADVASHALGEVIVTAGVAATAVGAVSAASQGGYQTRDEAVAAALQVERLYAAATEWAEGEEAAIAAQGPSPDLPAPPAVEPAASAALARVVRIAVGSLIASAGDIRTTREVVLDRPRALVELCAELYGSVTEAHLDAIIVANALTGDEIFELPAGRVIQWRPGE